MFTDSVIPHLFASKAEAEHSIKEDTPWYNANSDSPSWGDAFESSKEVEIVCVVLEVK